MMLVACDVESKDLVKVGGRDRTKADRWTLIHRPLRFDTREIHITRNTQLQHEMSAKGSCRLHMH